MLTNKAEYLDKPEVYRLLGHFETAHEKQDSLLMAITLRRLRSIGITIAINEVDTAYTVPAELNDIRIN